MLRALGAQAFLSGHPAISSGGRGAGESLSARGSGRGRPVCSGESAQDRASSAVGSVARAPLALRHCPSWVCPGARRRGLGSAEAPAEADPEVQSRARGGSYGFALVLGNKFQSGKSCQDTPSPQPVDGFMCANQGVFVVVHSGAGLENREILADGTRKALARTETLSETRPSGARPGSGAAPRYLGSDHFMQRSAVGRALHPEHGGHTQKAKGARIAPSLRHPWRSHSAPRAQGCQARSVGDKRQPLRTCAAQPLQGACRPCGCSG